MGEQARAQDASQEKLSAAPRWSMASGEGLETEPSSSASLESTEADRWCVDLGDAIVVRSTCELAAAFEAGEISSRTLVWREGHAIWEPMAHFPELMSQVAAAESLRPPAPVGAAPTEAFPRVRAPRSLAFSSAFGIGIVLGVLVALPFAWRGRAQSVDRLVPLVDATSRAAAAMVPKD